MKEPSEREQLIISYLLGELSDEDQLKVERQYFSDSDFLEQVLAVEDDLIDDYVRGGLSGQERARFESHFLASADRRDRVENAEALLAYLRKQEAAPAQSPAVSSLKGRLSLFLRAEGLTARLAFASLALLAVVIIVWLIVGGMRTRPQLTRTDTEGQRPQPTPVPDTAPEREPTEQPPQQPQPEQAQGKVPDRTPPGRTGSVPRPIIATFVLRPGLTRDTFELNRLVIPRGTNSVGLRLSIETRESYKYYRASLRRVEGPEILSQRLKTSRSGRGGKSGTLTLPADLLTPGEYLLTVSGTTQAGETEVTGDYPFTVASGK